MLFSVIVLEKDLSDVSETVTISRKNGVKKWEINYTVTKEKQKSISFDHLSFFTRARK